MSISKVARTHRVESQSCPFIEILENYAGSIQLSSLFRPYCVPLNINDVNSSPGRRPAHSAVNLENTSRLLFGSHFNNLHYILSPWCMIVSLG